MSAPSRASGDQSIPAALRLAFAPLHKRAFGLAIGAATGLVVLVATLVIAVRGPSEDGPNLILLSNYFAGYSVSVPGALIGGLWGLFVGFVAGWFFAFCRNFMVAVSVFLIRARAELNETRDFLDHI